MIDIQRIRDDAHGVAELLATRKLQVDFSRVLELDRSRREAITRLEALRNELKTASKEFPLLKKQGGDVEKLTESMKLTKNEIADLERTADNHEGELETLMLGLPNLPLPEVPVGADESDNRVVRVWGERPSYSFTPLSHDELGEKLGIMSSEIGVKLAKTRFTLLRKTGAKLERALMNFMLDHLEKRGYEEILPPFMVNSKALTGTGQLPKFAGDLFAIRDEDLYMVPTAEVPLTNIDAGQVIRGLERGKPLRYTAYSPCFRSEAGSYGKDTKGYIRQHQFNKVEMVKILHPADNQAEFEALTADAEAVLQKLGLHYRVVELCTGDLGFSSARTHDLEVWLPSQQTFREISSCSCFTDFQARRASIRYKDPETGKNAFAFTQNGSCLAIGRTLVAILENYQTADGDVIIPEILRPYMGGRTSLRPS
ncbi:MAG: serine--tRNA ligase [Planctomycetes bacterium]|nr:serine--tRNA ligase [Planctomycetota bacterium]